MRAERRNIKANHYGAQEVEKLICRVLEIKTSEEINLSEIIIKKVTTKKEQKEFIMLPWSLYKGDPFWVPPLISDMKATLNPAKNALLNLGPYAYFLAYKDGKAVARLGVGADDRLNKAKNRCEGYFTLFECISDYNVAKAIFDEALGWLAEKGYDTVTGPQSPSNGDDYRGLLVKGFGSSPVLMDSYNPTYYADFIEKYGFAKQFDRLAFYYDLRSNVTERFERGVEYAMKRYQFHCDPLDLKKIDEELKGVKQIIDEAHPEWPDMIPPSWEEIHAEANKLLQLAVPELVWFARTNDNNRPIGFVMAMPDYNQVLKKMNGRLFPIGAIKFILYKRRITGARSFIMFVSPDYQKKGVSGALYMHGLQAALAKGYVYGEGGTIHEFNDKMVRDAIGAGGDHYKTYRVYIKQLNQPSPSAANE